VLSSDGSEQQFVWRGRRGVAIATALLTSIEFIAIPNPAQAIFRNVVESYEIVISWETMDRSDPDFVQSFEEIL